MNAAIRKLHTDLVHLRKANSAEKKAEASVKTARAGEKSALDGIAAKQKAIADEFIGAAPQSLTVANILGALGKEFALGVTQVTTKQRFDAAIAKGQKQIAAGKRGIKADRQKALKDLRPAELQMGLKDTNRVRHELGLKSVAKPVRPEFRAGSWHRGPGTLKGADSSHWVSNAEFQRSLKGAQYSMVGATDGHNFVDPTFKSRWHQLGERVKSGKMAMRLAYHFMEPGDGVGQAKHFLKTVGVSGKLPAGTRLGLDWEAGALSDPRALHDAAKYIHGVTGVWPLVYTQASQLGNAKRAVPQAPMWEAHWGAKDDRSVPFFQDSAGESNGKGFDTDLFNGTLKALKRFAGFEV